MLTPCVVEDALVAFARTALLNGSAAFSKKTPVDTPSVSIVAGTKRLASSRSDTPTPLLSRP